MLKVVNLDKYTREPWRVSTDKKISLQMTMTMNHYVDQSLAQLLTGHNMQKWMFWHDKNGHLGKIILRKHKKITQLE